MVAQVIEQLAKAGIIQRAAAAVGIFVAQIAVGAKHLAQVAVVGAGADADGFDPAAYLDRLVLAEVVAGVGGGDGAGGDKNVFSLIDVNES